MSRAPAYQEYPGDELAAHLGLSLAAIGAVTQFRRFSWFQSEDFCSLPDDDKFLAGILGVSVEVWMSLREEIFNGRQLFIQKDGRIFSPHLKDQAAKQRKYRKLQAEKSRKGVEARATRGSSAGSSTGEARVTSPTPISILPIPIPSSISIKKDEDKTSAKQKTLAAVESEPAISAETWEAYRTAYQFRYQIDPVRNHQVNSHLKQLVKLLGPEEAPHVAAFYLSCSLALYITARHQTNLLIRDYASLRTQWATGIKATRNEAISEEKKDSLREQLRRITGQTQTPIDITPKQGVLEHVK